jgi:Tfp pilus assembly protein PilX
MALPLALFALMMLSGLLLAFLSMAGMEPSIAANLNDATQARNLAEAGIEWAFDALVAAPSLNGLLAGPNVVGSNPQTAWLTAPANTQITLPGLSANFGTYTVQVRNDILATDTAITGMPPDPGGPTTDQNNAVIVTATGTYRGVTRQIQVAMSGPWDLPAAIYEPNVDFVASCCGNVAFGGGNWQISGNDTNLDGTPGAGAAKLGIGYTDQSDVTDALGALGAKLSKVQGGVAQVNPVPWHLTVPSLTALFTQLAAQADQVVTAGYNGDLTKADGSPQVTLADLSAGGQLKLQGNTVGRGILLVKGGTVGSNEAKLAMDGNARFEGLIIICCGTRLYDAEIQGNSKIFGGVVNFSEDPTKQSLFNIENSAEIRRSVQGMALARQLMPGGRGRYWSWREL